MAERIKNRSNDILKVWQDLSERILSSILTDHCAYFPVANIVTGDIGLWPPEARPIWATIVQCVEADTLPTLQALKLRLNGDTPPEYLDYLHQKWSDEDNAKIVYHAEEMKQCGVVAKLRAVGRELAEIEDISAIPEAVGKADVGLSSVASIQANRESDAKSVSDAAWEQVDRFEGAGMPTGLEWFDRLAGGIWPGFNYWVVANYKSGKSTLIRNIILTLAYAGHQVDMLCAEGSRELFALDCTAMIATGLLLDRGVLTNKLRLSGLFILRVWGGNHREAILTKDEYECIIQAREIFEALPIRIHDSLDGIRDRTTIRHIVKKSKLNHGSKVFILDYSQLVGKENIYERQSAVALLAQDLAVTEKVAMIMLSQRNESSVRGGSGHSSGAKGGGDADAAADFTLIPSIDEDGNYKVLLKHSRHTAAGMSEIHHTNPSSGLIIDKWIYARDADAI
jgi:hypothetical protein